VACCIIVSQRAEVNGVQTTMQDHRTNRLLAALAPQSFNLLRNELRLVTLAQGRELYAPGDAIDQIYFPQTGLISLLVVTKEGGYIETSTVGRDGAVGLQSGLGPRRSFTRATAQISGQFSVIRADRFAGIVQADHGLRDLILRYTELVWAEAQQIAACNAGHDASARLARWLLQCADRIGSNEIALTQELLAQMLGVRRTTVTLLARTLQEQGFIKYSRGHIRIVDRDGLRNCACECYHVMKYDNLPFSIGVNLF
jgi:CRP-like cAMP-binding protein